MDIKTENHKAINIISYIGIIGLFLWISFFAPLVGGLWQFQFTFILIVLVCLHVKSYKLIFNRQDFPFWIFLLVIMGGLVNIKDSQIAYQHFWSFVFIIPFLYFFTKLAFRKEYGMIILRSICLMGLLVCVCGIMEFTVKENFIYKRLIYNFCYDAFKGRRMMSLHIHPAPLGTYLVAIFPLAIVLILREKKVFLKLSAVICAAIIFIGIVLTFSMGVFLGAFMAVSAMLFFMFSRKKAFFVSMLILLAVATTVIGVSSLLSHYGWSMFYRFSLQGLSAPDIYSNKIERFMSIWKILKEHAFFGLGLGHYRIFFDYYVPHLANVSDQLSKVPDCVYILLLAETGLVGFAGFILFIFSLFKNTWRRLRSVLEYEDRLLTAGFLSGFIGILCTFLTYDGLYWIAPSYLFWSYAGILSSQLE